MSGESEEAIALLKGFVSKPLQYTVVASTQPGQSTEVKLVDVESQVDINAHVIASLPVVAPVLSK